MAVRKTCCDDSESVGVCAVKQLPIGKYLQGQLNYRSELLHSSHIQPSRMGH